MTGSPQPTSVPPTPFRQRSRQSHISYASGIPSLALESSQLSPIQARPPSIRITMPSDNSPNSTRKSLMNDGESTHDEQSYENMKLDLLETDPHPATPTQARQSRAKSFVGGFVNQLRNIPRAMTHSQLYERRSSSRYSGAVPGVPGDDPHMQSPPGFPILLPPGIPFMPYMRPRMSGSYYTTSKEGYSESGSGSESFSSRLGDFLGELRSLPWISDRVVDDYIPGQSRSRGAQYKTSTPWYSLPTDSAPSEVTDKWKLVPEPWFPPQNLPATTEEPESLEAVPNSGENEGVPEEVKQLHEQVQAKTREVSELQQIVDHQKKHIAALEEEVEKLKQGSVQPPSPDIHRRRSSTRKSLYLKRDSVRTVASAARVSRSVSRPPSFFDH